jgi:hypothetical protein
MSVADSLAQTSAAYCFKSVLQIRSIVAKEGMRGMYAGYGALLLPVPWLKHLLHIFSIV